MKNTIISALKPFDRIIFVGGGTGGHISPIISLSREISHREMFWIGGKNSEEEKEAEKAGIPFFGIDVLKLSTTRSPRTALYPYVLTKGFFQAKKILENWKNEGKKMVIFSKWWPGAVAIGMAAKSLRIPLFLHESDVIPGRSNRRLSRMATKIFLGFEASISYFPSDISKNIFIPVGQILDKQLTEWTKKGKIVWKTQKMHILVFCGSQGARKIFQYLSEYCSDIDAEWIIVLWKLNTGMRGAFENFSNVQILDWLDKSDQRTIFEKTDMAITRGSATTLAELEIFQIPKIMVPLPSAASNHQYFNAKEYEKEGDVLLPQAKIHFMHGIITEFLEEWKG